MTSFHQSYLGCCPNPLSLGGGEGYFITLWDRGKAQVLSEKWFVRKLFLQRTTHPHMICPEKNVAWATSATNPAVYLANFSHITLRKM